MLFTQVLCKRAEMMRMKMPIRLDEDDREELICDDDDDDVDVEDHFQDSGKKCPSRFRQNCGDFFRRIGNRIRRYFDPDPALVSKTPKIYTLAFDQNREEIFQIGNRDEFFSSAQRSRLVYEILARAAFDSNKVSKLTEK